MDETQTRKKAGSFTVRLSNISHSVLALRFVNSIILSYFGTARAESSCLFCSVANALIARVLYIITSLLEC